ncbi:hypothetical protein JCM8547_001117 [Rhodosporidiobolus lusitaniae]
MRFSAFFAPIALAASSVSAYGWLPAVLSPKEGDVYKNGANMTIVWDNTGYNSSANSYGKFFLGYTDSGTTNVAQFVGKQSSYGDEYPLWEGSNSVTFQLDLSEGLSDYFGEQVWSITEFPLGDQSVTTGLFTVEA